MRRRMIAVLTDLDLAEHYLARGQTDKARLHVTVALENASREREICDQEDCDQICVWDEIVQDATKLKMNVVGKVTRPS